MEPLRDGWEVQGALVDAHDHVVRAVELLGGALRSQDDNQVVVDLGSRSLYRLLGMWGVRYFPMRLTIDLLEVSGTVTVHATAEDNEGWYPFRLDLGRKQFVRRFEAVSQSLRPANGAPS